MGVGAPWQASPRVSLEADLKETARDLARLLAGGGDGAVTLGEKESDLAPVEDSRPRLLKPASPSRQVWAVDGGQGIVADARAFSVVLIRTARVLMAEERIFEEAASAELRLLWNAPSVPVGLRRLAATDAGLLREAAEWEEVRRCVELADSGAMVMVDGDLRAAEGLGLDLVSSIARLAFDKEVDLVGVTKHSSLVRRGLPMAVSLEIEAARLPVLGERSRWWAPVLISSSTDGLRRFVAYAKLDPLARFAFRVDCLVAEGGWEKVEEVLGSLAAVSDDAAFPGYPYPLAVADRVAACPSWLLAELRGLLEGELMKEQVPVEVWERCVADRHRFMERE